MYIISHITSWSFLKGEFNTSPYVLPKQSLRYENIYFSKSFKVLLVGYFFPVFWIFLTAVRTTYANQDHNYIVFNAMNTYDWSLDRGPDVNLSTTTKRNKNILRPYLWNRQISASPTFPLNRWDEANLMYFNISMFIAIEHKTLLLIHQWMLHVSVL